MLESQQDVRQEGYLRRALGRIVDSSSAGWRKDVGDTDFSAMDGDAGGEGSVRGSVANSARSWQETRERVHSGCGDLGRELFVQTWRDRPRDAASVAHLLRRNVLALLLVLASGVVTWESSVDELRVRIDRTIVFPLYLPHSVALAVACVWTTAVAPGNLIGLYFARLYMIWRGHLGFTSVNTTIMLLVAFLATIQSHIGAFFLRKFLCTSETKRIPTIDSVAEAVWYLATVFFLSLVFGIVIALCITSTPLIQWSSFWRYWSTWWLGVLATMITVTPLLTHLLAWEYESSLRKPSRLLECLLVTLATSSFMVVLFFLNFEYFHPLPYFVFPLITWTAFRFNRVGWALTVSVIAYCCALGSIRKRGALYNLSSGASVSSPSLIIQVRT
jgi:integral membrane sensor domain MASE1